MLRRNANEEALRTVSAIDGMLGRLRYLASMQKKPGSYEHWGIAQEHGQQATSAAFRRSHLAVLESALQTDLPELHAEIEQAAEEYGSDKAAWLERVIGTPALDPPGSAQHSYLHFKYVLESLRALARRRS